MLTVLITRGQIIIRAGYFPAGCLYRKEATALGGGQAGGGRWRQAGRGAEGANPQPSALPRRPAAAPTEDVEKQSKFRKSEGRRVLLSKQRGAVERTDF